MIPPKRTHTEFHCGEFGRPSFFLSLSVWVRGSDVISMEVLLTDFLGGVGVFCVLCAPSVPCACTLAAESVFVFVWVRGVIDRVFRGYLCREAAYKTASTDMVFVILKLFLNLWHFLYPSLLGTIFYRQNDLLLVSRNIFPICNPNNVMSEFSFSLLLIATILFVLLTSDEAALIPLTSYGLLFSVFFFFSTYVEAVKKWSSPKLTFSSSSQPVGVLQLIILM